MGWKSTVTMTRSEVISAIYDAVYSAEDEELCSALEALTEDSGCNYQIVEDTDAGHESAGQA